MMMIVPILQLLTQWRQGLQAGGGSDIVRDLFQVQMETVLQCSESDEQVSETTQVRGSDGHSYKCHLNIAF